MTCTTPRIKSKKPARRFHTVCLAWLIGCSAGLAATSAVAVEAGDGTISDRWSVVGVIAGDESGGRTVGIVVLRHNASKRTYTLAIGDTLPNEFAYTLRSVKNRVVQVSDGRQPVTLAFAEPAADEGQDEQNRTARFIDSYYRSLSEQPMEAVVDDSARGAPDFTYAPSRRFSNLRDEVAQRYELYRTDRGGAFAGVDTPSAPTTTDGDETRTSDGYTDGGNGRLDADGFPEPPPGAMEYRSTAEPDANLPSDEGALTIISE